MFLCLEISVLLLLGHAAGRPAANSTVVTGIVTSLADACLDGVTHTIGELKTSQQQIIAELNRTAQEVKEGQQQTANDIAKLTQTTQEVKNGQQQVMQLLQEQLTALHEQLTEVQSRVTAHQEQLTDAKQQLISLHIPPPHNCPADWSRHGQTCYLVSPQEITGDNAASVCAALYPTARLASIHDTASNQHVSQLINSLGWWWVWIGLSRPAAGADWSWSDGTPLDYTSWGPGEPNNSGGNQNCIGTGNDGYWWDNQCSARRRALCQIRLA